MIAALDTVELVSSQPMICFPFPGPLSSGFVDQFIHFAAKTVGAAGAFLLLNCDSQPMIAHSFGDPGLTVVPTWELVAACSSGGAENSHFPVQIHRTDDRSLLATIALQQNGSLLGILGVSDPHPGSFSAAQKYVLQAIASEMADQLYAAHLRRGELPAMVEEIGQIARLRLLESVVVNATDSVVITEAEPIDAPGPRIQYVNPAFTRTTGYTLEDVIGKSPRLLQGPLSGREGPARIKAALKAWQPVEVELLNYRKDGTAFWVELSISPVCDEKGWFTHWVSVQRDVTERKANEETVAKMRMTGLQNEALSEEIRERKLAEAKLKYLAFHDGLTGVRNRGYLLESLQTAMRRTQQNDGYRAAIIYMDLNGFKLVNDTSGHRIGDLLLTEVARRLKECARVQDTLARLGGDEFTLLVNGLAGMDEAYDVTQRMLAAIRIPIVLAGMTLHISASAGICEVGKTYTDPESVLRDADIAMYCAKRSGGQEWILFDPAMHENASADLLRKLQLKAAVENHEFELSYQPLVNTRDRSICGVEALIRWNHPLHGPLAPDAFIPLAEETGLIVPIGRWALHQACLDFRILQRASEQPLCLSVNVSSRQLDEASFVNDLACALRESCIAPHRLQLEITESIFLKETERVRNLFEEIRALGVKIAFDDFGTGYSSLSYLDKFPIDTLKIDQSFVQHMIDNSVNADIVKMVIRLAYAAGIKVTAEGVETVEQAALLEEYGCTLAQGFLYSRPLSLQAMTKVLVRA